MKIEINDENALWQLFGGDDPETPGRWQRSFKSLRQYIYDTEPYHRRETTDGKLKQRFTLSDPDRHYVLVGDEKTVRVDQKSLLTVGKSLAKSCPELMVQYAGAADRQS